jgi:hypothetical protein
MAGALAACTFDGRGAIPVSVELVPDASEDEPPDRTPADQPYPDGGLDAPLEIDASLPVEVTVDAAPLDAAPVDAAPVDAGPDAEPLDAPDEAGDLAPEAQPDALPLDGPAGEEGGDGALLAGDTGSPD